MKVFVIGASGFVGTAVVQELLKAGHRVLGLARSEAPGPTFITAIWGISTASAKVQPKVTE